MARGQVSSLSRLPPTVLGQTLALVRRYIITTIHSPITTLIRNILWPGLLLGIGIYLAVNLPEGFEDKNGVFFVSGAAGLTKFATMFIAYSFGEYMIRDRASKVKSLMLSMGLKRISYYLANSIVLLISLLPITLTIAIVSYIYFIPDTECPSIGVATVFIVATVHLIAFIHFLTSLIISTSWSSMILVLFVMTGGIQKLMFGFMKNGSAWNPLLLLLELIVPYDSLSLFAASYLINKNSGEIILDDQRSLVSAPTYLIILGTLFWTIVFGALSRWFEEVWPWQQDSAIKGPCFCLNFQRQDQETGDLDLSETLSVSHTKYFERRENEGREVGIQVNKLIKLFSRIPAVNGVSLNIYRGETTLLLGHNGAGKSTLMNMILGLLQPDSGKVAINGFDKFGRSGLGVCPQTSIFDDELTVRQHFELFVDLKSNLSSRERVEHINQTLQDVGLAAHADKQPSELSGGMKRKLSLGLAFIGKSNVLILDEPSSGLDPDSRIFVWNAIRRYRSDRTVLLSTQHMEEADYLGDRIAIMSAGQVICCGSSGFLNKLFGTGYKLRIECKRSSQPEIMSLISSYFDKAKPADTDIDVHSSGSNTPRGQSGSSDFVVELQTSGDAEKQLISLLEQLESDSMKFGIMSYGLKSSSIEDVMLNTSKYFLSENNKSQTRLHLNATSNHIETLVEAGALKEKISTASQLYILMVKLALTYRNDWFTFISTRLVLPIAMLYFIVKGLSPFLSDTPDITGMFIIIYAIYYPSQERATKFKTIQLTSQLRVHTYWISFLIVELILISINVIALNFFLATSTAPLVQVDRSTHTVLSLAYTLFHLAGAAFAFLMSMVLNDSKSAVGYFTILNFFGLLFYGVVQLLMITKLSLDWLKNVALGAGVLLIPSDALYYITRCLHQSGYLNKNNDMVGAFGLESSDLSIGFGFFGLLFQITLYSALLALAERQSINIAYYTNLRNLYRILFKKANVKTESGPIDEDVKKETTKALEAVGDLPQRTDVQGETYRLIAANLSKSYLKGIRVVHNLSFTVKLNECFGLLGVNGAGKTTTFSMLAVETKPDQGTIRANGYHAQTDMSLFRERLGYDPQASPELLLTPTQALHLMVRLRGIPTRSSPMLINSILELLEMSEHRHKLASTLSGGTKRKLSLGMSLIGTPQLMLLDEPTAGVDPLARRGIWQLLKSLQRRNGASIVISSHAMEECEAICDRIAIMARGRLRCVGTFLHLRSKFAKGCTLRFQIGTPTTATTTKSEEPARAPIPSGTDSNEQIDHLVEELQQQLQTSIGVGVFKLTDKNANSATFSILDNQVRRSILFKMASKFRKRHESLNLSYVINDASLEDIFITMAREEQELQSTS